MTDVPCILLDEKATMLQQKEKEIAKTFAEESLEVQDRQQRRRWFGDHEKFARKNSRRCDFFI